MYRALLLMAPQQHHVEMRPLLVMPLQKATSTGSPAARTCLGLCSLAALLLMPLQDSVQTWSPGRDT